MGNFNLVQVDAFFDGFAAQQAKERLELNGILSFVEGANTNSALFIGSAAAGVKLLVAAEDESRACEVLQQLRSELSEEATWYCGECEELNQPSFDMCWSCNKSREEVEAPAPVLNAYNKIKTSEDEAEPGTSLPSFESGNPYQPPVSNSRINRAQSTQHKNVPSEDIDQAEEIIQRAWRASIFGILFPVGVFHAYSVFLLVGVDGEVPISERSKSQLRRAWTVNIFCILLFCFLVRAMVVP